MEKLTVNANTKQYPIYINDSFDNLAKAFSDAALNGRSACVITDSNVGALYLDAVLEKIGCVFSSVNSCQFSAGEENKNLVAIQEFYKSFFENRLDRDSVIIALGGGVTGDMAGFAAATYMRGISFVQIPTTLLSQVDSSIGGKTGIDFMGAKNIIGAFYQPEFVYINTRSLETLPNEQFVSGMGEVIKHGLLRDRSYLDFICSKKEKIKALDTQAMQKIIHGSCKIKAEIVGLDEKETGLRETLNFGHTFGHAVEALSGLTMPHGHCVGIGMCAALYLSMNKGGITNAEFDDAMELLDYFTLPTTLSGDISFNADDIYNLMIMDKKAKAGGINLILLNGIGNAYTYKNVPRDEIMDGINFMLR